MKCEVENVEICISFHIGPLPSLSSSLLNPYILERERKSNAINVTVHITYYTLHGAHYILYTAHSTLLLHTEMQQTAEKTLLTADTRQEFPLNLQCIHGHYLPSDSDKHSVIQKLA